MSSIDFERLSQLSALLSFVFIFCMGVLSLGWLYNIVPKTVAGFVSIVILLLMGVHLAIGVWTGGVRERLVVEEFKDSKLLILLASGAYPFMMVSGEANWVAVTCGAAATLVCVFIVIPGVVPEPRILSQG